MSETIPILDDNALAALNKTRPWMYLIGICSIIGSLLALLAVLGGVIGIGANPERARLIMAFGIGVLVVSLPSAIVQMGYALALSRVNEASGSELAAAVELACMRQRNLWVVNGLTAGLIALLLLFTTITTLI